MNEFQRCLYNSPAKRCMSQRFYILKDFKLTLFATKKYGGFARSSEIGLLIGLLPTWYVTNGATLSSLLH